MDSVARPERNERVFWIARWGLVSSWTKDPDAVPKPINARADGLVLKPTFRGAFRHGRCLIPGSGFYEWKAVGRTKVPHYIQPRDGGIFVFAGLTDSSHGADGDLQTCTTTIITTEPNSLMAAIHNRMPVILGVLEQEFCLDSSQRSETLLTLLRPYPEDEMEAFPVGNGVNNVQNDRPELVVPIENWG